MRISWFFIGNDYSLIKLSKNNKSCKVLFYNKQLCAIIDYKKNYSLYVHGAPATTVSAL